MAVMLNLSPEEEASLKAQAQTRGLTVQEWLLRLARQAALVFPAETPATTVRRSPQEAVQHILELQKYVQPDPEGWTMHDYINYGRP